MGSKDPRYPIVGTLDDFCIGKPVFWAPSSSCTFDPVERKYIPATSTTNLCHCVKATGVYNEFYGICTGKNEPDQSVNQATVTVPSSGFVPFYVDDSKKYCVGQTILFNGVVLNDNQILNWKIYNSIVGSIESIMDGNCLIVHLKR